MIENKISDTVRSETLATRAKSYDGRITKASKKSQQNNSEAVTNENDKEISKERYMYIYIYIYIYIYPEKIQNVIDNLDINIIIKIEISKNNKLVIQYTKSTN